MNKPVPWQAAGEVPDLQEACAALARLFHVHVHEVGLLRVRGNWLEFVFPPQLQSAGRIPLSSSAVAARTAKKKKAEFFNNFTEVVHQSVFELVPLGDSARPDFNPDRIQKLMTAPVVDSEGTAIGVVQISRKGATRDAAGADFTEQDLRGLEQAAPRLAGLLRKF